MPDDAIQSFLSTYGQSETGVDGIPHQRSACCCGNDACAYLKKNESALEGLERDVRTAARLGQVCSDLIAVCWRSALVCRAVRVTVPGLGMLSLQLHCCYMWEPSRPERSVQQRRWTRRSRFRRRQWKE